MFPLTQRAPWVAPRQWCRIRAVLIPAAAAVLFDSDGRILLVRRGRPPEAGRWSVPGGKCEPGETTAQACVREVSEETGLQVEVVGLAGRIRRPGPDGNVFAIDDFVCRLIGGVIGAADDAADAGWFARSEFDGLELAVGLREALDDWNLLPR